MARPVRRKATPGRVESARALAVRHLARIEADRAFVGLVAEEEPGRDAREERQATDYVAGVTRWRRWLDFLIAHFYRRSPDRLEPALRQILRVGLYDLLFLRTPPHAAIHEAVELAKQLVRPAAGGLVNGLLRAVLRAGDRLPEPETGDPAEDLAIRYAHPTWMVARWLDRFGPEETEALLRWNNARPVYALRINPLKSSAEAFRQRLDAEGIAWEPSPYLDEFVRVPRLQAVLRAGLVADGWCAVQDESAGLVVRLLDPRPGETVVDGCAAPGGKALFAAERMDNRGTLLAFDVHENRVGLIRQAAEARGLGILEAAVADLRLVPGRPDAPRGDRVLLDAPCSGLGVLAKRADLRWNRNPEDLTALTALQDELLEAAAQLVRPGGLLVYSTCTIEPEENRARIERFLERHPAFQAERADGFVPTEMVTPEGYFQTLPQVHGTDGAFAVRLRRGEG